MTNVEIEFVHAEQLRCLPVSLSSIVQMNGDYSPPHWTQVQFIDALHQN